MKKVLETERLYLREITRADFNDWNRILSNPESMRYYPGAFDEAKVNRWLDWTLSNYQKYGFGLWAVILKESNTFIGDCGITMQMIDGESLPEVGFHIALEYTKKGYASEAAKAVLDYAFKNFNFGAIYCYQKYTNVPSQKTALKIGMSFIKKYPDE